MRITHPYLLWRHLRRVMNLEVEELWASALSADKRLLRSRCLFRGTVDTCFVHPRDIFRFAILENASSLIIAHNHPSGSLEPSKQDLLMHKKFQQGAKLLQVPLNDHLIITAEGYFSFLEKGLMS